MNRDFFYLNDGFGMIDRTKIQSPVKIFSLLCG